MMDESYERLLQRIRARCYQQRWYGPDMYNPFKLLKQMHEQRMWERENFSSLFPGSRFIPSRKTLFWYDKNGHQYQISADTDLSDFPLLTDFEYSPATEEQLVASERALGYLLPPLLRTLYATVANGGFGLGYGLYGAIGGFQGGIDNNFQRDIDPGITKDHDAEKKSVRQLNLWIDGSLNYREIPFNVWPLNYLFTLCHWGDGICSYLDCLSGYVLRGEIGDNAYILRSEATSLYEWLDLWTKEVDLWSTMYLKEKPLQ